MKRLKVILLLLFMALSLVGLSGCRKMNLETPSNLEIDEDNNLTWMKISGAKTYNVIFYHLDTDTTETKSTRKPAISLDSLEVGDYDIQVEAIPSDKSVNKSGKSEVLQFHKYFETGCVYTLINNKTEYEVTKVGRANGTFEIEDNYRGKAVTRIADKCFKGSTRVISIKVGKNVMTIGDNAFYNCAKLEEVVIPESVREIGLACFQSCRSLKEIALPESIIEVPDYTFAYCRGLEKATIGSMVERIGISAFQDCSSLKEFTIPERVTEIGSLAFSHNILIESIAIPKNLAVIEAGTFYNCESLKTVSFSEDSKLEEILETAFFGCTSIEEITIPDGATNIGYSAFESATSLKTVDIPPTVSHVGADAFKDTFFYNDQIEKGNTFIYADDWLISVSEDFKDTVEDINTSTLSNTIVGVADTTFKECPELKSVVLPSSFKYIGQEAFSTCPKLWRVRTLDDSIELIDDFAFAYCAITNVSLGVGLKRIGKYAFCKNPNLDNNQLNPRGWIPETVTSIGTDAFRDTKIAEKAKNSEDPVIYAGNWACGLGRSAAGTITLNFDTDRVAGIADYAFYGSQLSSIVGVSNARYIGKGAFAHSQYLINVSLNRNLTEIRDFTFYDCISLIRVTCPRTLKSIGKYAFMDSGLSELDLSSTNCESIGASAFHGSRIESISFSKSTKYIGDYAFYKSHVGNITLPENLEFLGQRAFYDCPFLKTVEIGSKLEAIKEKTFYNCTALETINIPENIKEIGRSAFYSCVSLKSLELKEGLEYIGDYCFYDIKEIKELSLPSTLENIGNYAFKGMGIETIAIKSTVKKIGQHAFYGCENLTIITDAEMINPEWHERFNSTNRPMFYGVKFTDSGSIDEITLSLDKSLNLHALNGIKLFEINKLKDSSGNEYDLESIKDISLDEETKLKVIS